MCMHVHENVHERVRVHVRVRVRLRVHVRVHVRVCVCVCVWMYVCVCTSLYIWRQMRDSTDDRPVGLKARGRWVSARHGGGGASAKHCHGDWWFRIPVCAIDRERESTRASERERAIEKETKRKFAQEWQGGEGGGVEREEK